MRQRFRTFMSLVLVCTLLFSIQASFATDNDSEYNDLTKYNIEVAYDDDNMKLSVTQIVEFTNTYGEDLENLVLHLYPDSYGSLDTMPAIGRVNYTKNEIQDNIFGDIDILDVKTKTKELKFSEENEILKINLEEVLKNDENIELTITFDLKIPEGRHRLGYYENVVSLTNWYPIMSIYDIDNNTWDENPYHPIGESNYSNVADYNVTFNVPKEIIIASTGVDIEEKNDGDRKIIVVEANKVRDFVAIMSEDYKVVSQEIDGIKINSFYLTSDDSNELEKQNAEILLEVVGDTVRFFNETIGKYPYKELDITETYLAGGAMEYPQLIQMGKYDKLDKEYKSKNKVEFIIEAAVHEVIHQWWYVSVGNNEFKEPFMDESMTVYSTAYYFEKTYGKYHEKSTLMEIKNGIRPYRGTPCASSVDEFVNLGEYIQSAYMQGPIVLEDLRSQVGEEKFVEILKTYFNRYLYKNGSIEKFLEIIEEIAGKEVKESIEKALTTTSYYPMHLLPTEEEENEIIKQSEISRLKDIEDDIGMNFGSIYLNGLEGEKIYIATPDSIKVTEESLSFLGNKKPTEVIISEMVRRFEEKGIDYEIINQSEIQDKQLKENIILMGNMTDNGLMKKFKAYFPVRRISKWLLVDGITIKSNETHGAFIMENPYDSNNNILVNFWDDEELLENSYYQYTNMWNEFYQFKISVGTTKEIMGRY